MEIAGIDVVQVIEVVVALAVTYLAARIVSRALVEVFERTPFPEEIERGIVRGVKYVVYVVGVFVVISLLGVDLTTLIVGLGAFSIAISFATSNIIQNFVSGILVLSDRAFVDGDEIMVRIGGKEYEGEVVKIGIRTTIVETKDGNTVIIPNSAFVSNPVVRRKRASTNT
ncbi:MAG: mechanosensitive ion channel [Candidatus Bathyarchaeota archaeon]|nr:mechanosensitive ion channel [Candidatus Bathyarchaeota archaeon]